MMHLSCLPRIGSGVKLRLASSLIGLLIITFPVYADTYTCTQTLRTIKTGDSMAAVKAACGEPLATTAHQASVQTPVQAVRWMYGVRSNLRTPIIPLFVLLFENRKLIQIDKSEGIGSILAHITCLDTGILKLGMPMEDVIIVCGAPSMVNTAETMVSSSKSLIIWTYDQGQFHNKINFEFENGYLTHIRRK